MDINILLDNDSGYVSHFPESNSNSNDLPVGVILKTSALNISEDALLEQPKVLNIDDSVVENSQESFESELSGFNESFQSQIIPQIDEIVANLSASSDMSIESPVNDSRIIETSFNNVSTLKIVSDIDNLSIGQDCSPDLFSGDESFSDNYNNSQIRPEIKIKTDLNCDANTKEMKMLKRVQRNLSGVCPPPQLTIIKLSVDEMLQKISDNRELFAVNSTNRQNINLSTWPDVLNQNYHGLHYNKSHISEEFECLCLKYAERYVGAETQSSCTVFLSNSSPPNRKTVKNKWNAKSPGRRLSHIARRRITFSNSSLSANNSAILGSRAQQILVDAKKLSTLTKRSPRKSPFKRRKSPLKKPSSSTASSSATHKRALFQSPQRSDLKRRRLDFGEVSNPNKSISASQPPISEHKQELSTNQKRKLQLAVYEALCLHNVKQNHPQFKSFASNLARVTRRLMPHNSGEVDKMRRIARCHSYWVIKGKTVDEIVNEYEAKRVKNQKLQGYIAKDDFNGINNLMRKDVLQDKANIIKSGKEKEVDGLSNSAKSGSKIDRIRKVISFDDQN